VAGVFWQVLSIPEIGLHTTLRNVVNRADPNFLVIVEGPTSSDPRELLREASYEQIGDDRIETYPQLLDARAGLSRATFVERDSLPARGVDNYVRWNQADWVRVRLRTVEATPRQVTVWCRVAFPSAAALVPTMVWFALELGVFAVAAFVYWQRPGDRAARQFFVMTAFFIAAFMGGYHWWRLVYQPPLLLGFILSAVFLPAVSLHFYLLFPRPKPWYETRRASALALIYVPAAAFATAIVVGDLAVLALHSGGAPAGTIRAALSLVRGSVFAYLVVALAWYAAIVYCLSDSYRTARDATERDQVRWILYGSVLASVPLMYSLYLAIFRPGEFGGGSATWPMFAASVCFTGSFAVSITRYRLLQLDQLVSSGMAYFLVSGVAAAVYYLLVFTGALLMGWTGVSGPSVEQALWVSGVALVMTAGLDLARSRLRRALDRRYRRDKTQLDQTLYLLGEAVAQLVDPPTLARRLLRAAADTLDVPTGAVYVRDGDPPAFRVAGGIGPILPAPELTADGPLVAALGTFERIPPRAGAVPIEALVQLRAIGGAAAVALTHEGVLRAVLVLGPKAGGPYSPEDLELLAAFAPFTALALAGAEGHRTIESLNRELQTKIEKISEQQRRILVLQQQLTTQAKFAAQADEPKLPDEPIEPLAVGGIVGGGRALRQVLSLARKVAASPSAVLIRGESGTGKGLLAKAVHDTGPRAGRPFVKVHCAALASGVLESELFGHVKGAFTGAVKDKVGRFEMADGGTLFLDEIGDISLDVQTKLLRVLQEKTFERVGSSDPVQVDVRLVAATHQDLEQLIRLSKFREDLYYRLNVITLSVPPLRDRPEDIPELAHHFLAAFAHKCAKPLSQIDDDALVALRLYHWPGNVRELENAIERAVVVADGPVLTVDDLPAEVRRHAASGAIALAPPSGGGRWGYRAQREGRDRRERDALLRALESTGGNKAEAARILGIARSTLISRLKKYDLLSEKWAAGSEG
jgi:transcriptional regulator with GAF, ATPase, and Fis domain